MVIKGLIFFFLLTLIASCNEETQEGKNLSALELANLRNVSATKCRAENTEKMKTFRDNSNKIFSQARGGNQYKVEYKEGATALESNDMLSVWKVTPTAIYYLITSYNTQSDPNTTYRFLKITKTNNDDIAADLLEKFCSKGPNDYNSFSFDSSGVVLSKVSGAASTTADVEIRTTKTYTYNSAYPLFFAAFRIETKKQDYVISTDTATGTATTTSRSLVAGAEAVFPSTLYTYYNDYGSKKTLYCVPSYTTSGSTKVFQIPLTENCSETSLPEFNPATELVL